ncbi:TetR/AcrR family transcriptional regulator [Solihabitans fulvus]|uniref:TetR/AcrR family transcriptional regulator n=1 Tax=Solihabitans fulvus TaxID=1892852 RepID=A0A5B2WV80_9PSEU|nr:TetR/AcrR family transcriptional regulator [Solihabitans fulvus]KAA2255475.1 TetR/AcrR family transcriptional regulator [Solihabitans fulvus]
MAKRTPRGSVTREAVMDAALAVADRDGYEAVTIRALAAEVGVPPMTLYTHFADKAALREGMRERAFEQVVTATAEGSWQEALEEFAGNCRAVLRAHPNWVPLLAAQTGAPSAATLRLFERVFDKMIADGLPPAQTVYAVTAVLSFASGCMLFEGLMVGAGTAPLPTARLDLVRRLHSPDQHPGVAAATAAVDDFSFDAVFELGVRSLVEGIEKLRGS